MKLSEGVEWGIHCAAILAGLPPGATLPAAWAARTGPPMRSSIASCAAIVTISIESMVLPNP